MELHRRSKNNTKPLIKQILDLIPAFLLLSCIRKYYSDKVCHKYKTYDQLLALTFGQLEKCYTLSDISCGLSISSTYLYDLGIRQNPARSTMSDGNKNRYYRVFEELYYSLLKHYGGTLTGRRERSVIKEVENSTVKLIDSTIVSLCLNLFDWAKFRTAKGGLKIYTVETEPANQDIPRHKRKRSKIANICCNDSLPAFGAYLQGVLQRKNSF